LAGGIFKPKLASKTFIALRKWLSLCDFIERNYGRIEQLTDEKEKPAPATTETGYYRQTTKEFCSYSNSD
jgi:hypothetical protein